MTHSTSGRRQKYPHTKTTDTLVFNHPWQVSFSAPPGPDTPERKPESQDPGSRQEQHKLWVSARVKRDEGATQSQLRGQLGQQPASVVLSPPAPPPLAESPSPAARRLLPRGERSFRRQCWRNKSCCSPPELAASAGAPPARSALTLPPGRRLEAGRARLPPGRSRHCPVRRHSLGTKAKCRLHPDFKRAQRAEPGTGSSRPGALPTAQTRPCPIALRSVVWYPYARQRTAQKPPVTLHPDALPLSKANSVA